MSRTAVLAVAGLLLVSACGEPIRVRRADPQHVHRHLTANVLTTDRLSQRTANLLYYTDLSERYDDDPAGALAELHALLVADRLRPDSRVSLAELSFRHAQDGGGQPYFLATALYAWAYLFPENPEEVPDRFDPRLRLACDLYNRGITEGFESGDKVDLRAGTYPLPFGTLEVNADPATFRWGRHQVRDFVPVAELDVEGLETVHRWPGIGAPLAAGVVPSEDGKFYDILGPRIRVPVTAILRPSDVATHLRDGRVTGTIELYAGYGEETVPVGEARIPLEAEPTAVLAFSLAGSGIFKRELTGFLRGSGVIEDRARLVSTRPYRRGLIPVVFVHGTGSSAARWAQMYNYLDNDPRIHSRFQFWFFSYSTGNPIAYSSMLLRESLQSAVSLLDPDGKDPALRDMVVIGHSQGGLLTKMTVVESGDAFWRNVSNESFDDFTLTPKTRDLLRRALFVHPLPFVRRVVFVATPHAGSYVAGNWLAHQAARLIKAPLDVTRMMTEFATANREALAIEKIRGAPTAVDNMTPKNPFVQKLHGLPIAPGVRAHSIISVDGVEPWEGKNDGVVEYNSAHIDGVDSELVVRSPHSCQSNPHTVAEVRRILLEHLADGGDRPASGTAH